MQRTILIVEDHPLYAEALERAISSAIIGAHVVFAPTIADAIATFEDGREINLIILDLRLPDANGLEGLIALRTRAPAVPIIIHSAFADSEVIHNALLCGATAYIPKAAEKKILLNQIAEVLNGQKPPRICEELPAPCQPEHPAQLPQRLSALTRQQMRVLKMICQGLLNKQIAHSLDINESTVKAHVSEILKKLRVASRTQAVVAISNISSPTVEINEVEGK